jgi:hypothetical protein
VKSRSRPALRVVGSRPAPALAPNARRKKRPRRDEEAPAPKAVSYGAIGLEAEFTVLLDRQRTSSVRR